jgi:hypothetical protein
MTTLPHTWPTPDFPASSIETIAARAQELVPDDQWQLIAIEDIDPSLVGMRPDFRWLRLIKDIGYLVILPARGGFATVLLDTRDMPKVILRRLVYAGTRQEVRIRCELYQVQIALETIVLCNGALPTNWAWDPWTKFESSDGWLPAKLTRAEVCLGVEAYTLRGFEDWRVESVSSPPDKFVVKKNGKLIKDDGRLPRFFATCEDAKAYCTG